MSRSLILYNINAETAPHFVIREAFKKQFSWFDEYDWRNIKNRIGLEPMLTEFLNILKAKRPDYTFMQIQNPESMPVAWAREMAKYTKIINWSGDVRDDNSWFDWFESIGREIFLTTFCNMSDVRTLRMRGVLNTEYLPAGYDDKRYYLKPGARSGSPKIVFCANYFDKFPLSKFRKDITFAFREEFKDDFRIVGNQWSDVGIRTQQARCEAEAELYSSAFIGLSVSNLYREKYSSSRLLRIMACGAVPLVYDYPGIEDEFNNPHGRTMVVFYNINDAIDKAKKILQDPIRYVDTIGKDAAFEASNYYTWDVQVKKLVQIIDRYENGYSVI